MSGFLSEAIFGSVSEDELKTITSLDMTKSIFSGIESSIFQQKKVENYISPRMSAWEEFCNILKSCVNLTTLTLAYIPWYGDFDYQGMEKEKAINAFFNPLREALYHCSKLNTVRLVHTRKADTRIVQKFKGAFDSVQTVYFLSDEVSIMSTAQIDAWAEIFPEVSQCLMIDKNQLGKPNINIFLMTRFESYAAQYEGHPRQLPRISKEKYSANSKRLEFKIGRSFKKRTVKSACIIYQASQEFIINNTSKQINLPIEIARLIAEYLSPFIANGVEALHNPFKKFLWQVSQTTPRPSKSIWASLMPWLYPAPPSILLRVLAIATHKDQTSINYREIACMVALLNLIKQPESTKLTAENRTKLINSGYSIFEQKLKTDEAQNSEDKEKRLLSFLDTQQTYIDNMLRNIP